MSVHLQKVILSKENRIVWMVANIGGLTPVHYEDVWRSSLITYYFTRATKTTAAKACWLTLPPPWLQIQLMNTSPVATPKRPPDEEISDQEAEHETISRLINYVTLVRHTLKCQGNHRLQRNRALPCLKTNFYTAFSISKYLTMFLQSVYSGFRPGATEPSLCGDTISLILHLIHLLFIRMLGIK